jgi:MtN3 and saliva related transmembrane protein
MQSNTHQLKQASRQKTPKIKTMNLTDWIGSAAATLTTTAFIPQAWKVWHTKHTADISLGMYALFTLGVSLWLGYGILLAAWPIIIANCITLLLAGAVLVMKLKFG